MGIPAEIGIPIIVFFLGCRQVFAVKIGFAVEIQAES
jgi:hypothetical protein